MLNTLSDRTLARLTLNAKKKDEDDEDEKDGKDEDDEVDNADDGDASAHGDVKPLGDLNPKPADNCKGDMKTNQLSNEDKQFMALGRKLVNDQRTSMIKTITANARNPFNAKELGAMDFEQLGKLAQLAHNVEEAEVPMFTLNTLNRASYFGSAAGVGMPMGDDGTDDDILPTLTLNFSEIASKGITKSQV